MIGWALALGMVFVVLSAIKLFLQERAAEGPKPESPVELHDRLCADADRELPRACTNAVVGIRMIVHSSISRPTWNPDQWHAEALVEYFNKVGGVERRPVKFGFVVDTNRGATVLF